MRRNQKLVNKNRSLLYILTKDEFQIKVTSQDRCYLKLTKQVFLFDLKEKASLQIV